MDDPWAFGCALWARPGVEEGLLRLQNEHGLSVALLILLCWRGDFDPRQLPRAAKLAGRYERLWIEPLRRRRRAAEGEARAACLAAELAAERRLLEGLARRFGAAGEEPGAALKAYLAAGGAEALAPFLQEAAAAVRAGAPDTSPLR
ncbi:MAG: hypothetical protein KatS3mg124_2129 [Porticoccaceae bacterium]|nr:MAG: hypothetical protein KatS3mg124_2129 [Porticoccaceae bacterium]